MARLSPNPPKSLLLPMTISISTLPQTNIRSTTLLGHASTVIVALLSSSPSRVSHAYLVTCSKDLAAISRCLVSNTGVTPMIRLLVMLSGSWMDLLHIGWVLLLLDLILKIKEAAVSANDLFLLNL